MRRNREAWQAIVAEYRASGLTAQVFARRQRINVGTLRWWCTQLRKEAPAKANVPVRFVPVRQIEAVRAPRLVEVHVNDVAMRFEAGTDVEYLTALIRGLGGAC